MLWADLTNTLWTRVATYVAIGVVVAVVATAVVSAVFRAVARRRGWPQPAVLRLRWPLRWLLLVIAAWIAAHVGLLGAVSRGTLDVVDHAFLIIVILVAGWFAATLVSFFVALLLARTRTDAKDNRVARRIQTQALVIRRVAVVVIGIVAVAAALLTFPAAQTAGASLLASAGVVSIIAGIAAQSTLGNVIAGVQLAFSGAIRVDDVVIANLEWGRIEEITLTYVVVHIWDDRRMVLPSTYFTTTPFENWTRTSSELMQSVDFDLDFRVDPQGMRDRLHEILAATDLWDGRVAVLQVTDAIGGVVHVRVLVTAVDAPTLFDLRCLVREQLVKYLRTEQPQALPRTRVLLSEAEQEASGDTWTPDDRRDRDLFSGSAAAERRGRDFTGPVQIPPA